LSKDGCVAHSLLSGLASASPPPEKGDFLFGLVIFFSNNVIFFSNNVILFSNKVIFFSPCQNNVIVLFSEFCGLFLCCRRSPKAFSLESKVIVHHCW
jgi:hypothetical protein